MNPPKPLWMSVRANISANMIQFIHKYWFTMIYGRKETSVSMMVTFPSIASLLRTAGVVASYVLAICGLSRLDIKTYSSINSSAVYPTSTQPLLLSDWWSVLCMLARPIRTHHPAAKRHPTLQHLHRLSWRAGKVGCLGTTDLQYSVTCDFSSQATHRTWCSTWTLASATVAFGSSVFKIVCKDMFEFCRNGMSGG